MTLPRRVFLRDEELGKKYDDEPSRRSAKSNPLKSSLPSSWKPPRKRRMLLAFVGICILYLFFKNRSTDLTSASKRFNHLCPNPRFAAGQQPVSDDNTIPSDTLRRLSEGQSPDTSSYEDVDGSYNYNGPIKFYSLFRTLNSEYGYAKFRRSSKGVLFAAADLKALSDLVPLACEMARQNYNIVHFAVMGRNNVSIEGIQMVNGVDKEGCPVFWHDARPDYASRSTDARMEASVKAGLWHFHNSLRPRATITHGESHEERFFWTAAKAQAGQIGMHHINLPARAANFMWMSKLDSSSLGAWNKVNMEILVHALPASSGSLIRLLESLHEADYFGDAPGLTIGLPPNADPHLLYYLSSFKWPPKSEHCHFTLRRRIQLQIMTPEEAAIRTIDSIYPKNPVHSHVLVLSPQTDLAPSYYHFLKYAILKFKYSIITRPASHRLLGISLELPSAAPTADYEPFTPPTPSEPTDSLQDVEKDIPVFLWQAPNSNAALYFGDKWVEFHSFLTNRLQSQSLKSKFSANLISEKLPSWMEYMLELIRARGYYLLYPSFPASTDFVLATTHSELYHQPEEYHNREVQKTSQSETGPETETYLGDEKIDSPKKTLTDSTPEKSREQIPNIGAKERVLAGSSTISNLLSLFPGGLPELSSLGILPYSQRDGPSLNILDRTKAYMKEFRKNIGGCDAAADDDDDDAEQRVDTYIRADDLFCLGEDD
ncbi:uncharacterized protein PADG_05559 [Paracoccidioides brasiliensis Pb18]|uniref:Uncharacterized protein n=1 Tax=Paracoccidioides brasiliensis (strain Pb18) TaxID=502780 RepID=C1GE73_PARBD|nr:uncharacterized protein PADG_05559 [Paracoccidioides brasiliensis Pb18]EEH49480.2 hypothetical protein PADG_05559 [Paracoccidioides brasiliensis Pb18]